LDIFLFLEDVDFLLESWKDWTDKKRKTFFRRKGNLVGAEY
jgi:hypothetical protein